MKHAISTTAGSTRRQGRTATVSNLRVSTHDFVLLFLWVGAFLGGGYLLLGKPLLDRWIF
jgi:hypothetical protein